MDPSINPKDKEIIFTLAEDAMASIVTPTKVEINPRENTFENIYSSIFKGDINIEFKTRSLFSKSTIAPIKKNPRAAGSEKIITTDAVPLHEGGNAKTTPIYTIVIMAYTR